jgi:hypothetical protein
MSTKVRESLRAMLAPLVPTTWTIVPYTVKTIGKLDRPTLYIEHVSIDPLAEAPLGDVRATARVTLVSHLTDYVQAEDALDDDVFDLIIALDSHDRLAWTGAEKLKVADYLGWQITLTHLATKEP